MEEQNETRKEDFSINNPEITTKKQPIDHDNNLNQFPITTQISEQPSLASPSKSSSANDHNAQKQSPMLSREKLERYLNEARMNITKLDREIKMIKNEKQTSTQQYQMKIKTLEDEIARLKKKLAEVQSLLKEEKEKYDSLENQIASLEETHNKKLDDYKAENLSKTKKIRENHSNGMKNKEAEIKELNEKIKELEDKMSKCNIIQYEAKEEEIKEMKNKLRIEEDNVKDLKKKLKLAEEFLKGSKSQIDTHIANIKRLELELQKLSDQKNLNSQFTPQQELESLNNSLKITKNELKQAEQEKKDLINKRDKLVKDKEELDIKYKALVKNYEQMKEKLENANKELENANKDLEKKTLEAKEWKLEVEKAREETKNMRIEAEKVKIEMEKAKKELGETRKSMISGIEQVNVEKEDVRAKGKQAKTETEKAVEEVRQAKMQTEKALAEAKQARAEADKAKFDAMKAISNTEKARLEVERAKVEAEKAKAKVEKAKAETEMAKAEAQQAKVENEKAAEEARQAKMQTERALAVAKQARAEVDRAKSDAMKAIADAAMARSEVERAKAEVERSKTKAKQAQAETEQAKAEAKKAKVEAEQVKANAEQIQQDAERSITEKNTLIMDQKSLLEQANLEKEAMANDLDMEMKKAVEFEDLIHNLAAKLDGLHAEKVALEGLLNQKEEEQTMNVRSEALEAEQTRSSELEEELNKIRQVLTSEIDRAKALEEEVSNLNTSLQILEEERTQAISLYSQSQEDLKTANLTLENLKIQNTVLKEELTKAKFASEAKSNIPEELGLRRHDDLMKQPIENLNNKLGQVQKERDLLKKEYTVREKKTKEKLDKAKKEIQGLKNNIDKPNLQIPSDNNNINSEAFSESLTLQAPQDEILKEKRSLEQSFWDVQEEKTTFAKELEIMTARYIALSEEYDKLKSNIREEKVNKDKNKEEEEKEEEKVSKDGVMGSKIGCGIKKVMLNGYQEDFKIGDTAKKEDSLKDSMIGDSLKDLKIEDNASVPKLVEEDKIRLNDFIRARVSDGSQGIEILSNIILDLKAKNEKLESEKAEIEESYDGVRKELENVRSESDKKRIEMNKILKNAMNKAKEAQEEAEMAKKVVQMAKEEAQIAKEEAKRVKEDVEMVRKEARDEAKEELNRVEAQFQNAKKEANEALNNLQITREEFEAAKMEAHNARIEAKAAQADSLESKEQTNLFKVREVFKEKKALNDEYSVLLLDNARLKEELQDLKSQYDLVNEELTKVKAVQLEDRKKIPKQKPNKPYKEEEKEANEDGHDDIVFERGIKTLEVECNEVMGEMNAKYIEELQAIKGDKPFASGDKPFIIGNRQEMILDDRIENSFRKGIIPELQRIPEPSISGIRSVNNEKLKAKEKEIYELKTKQYELNAKLCDNEIEISTLLSKIERLTWELENQKKSHKLILENEKSKLKYIIEKERLQNERNLTNDED